MKPINALKLIFFTVLIYFVWLTLRDVSFTELKGAILSVDLTTYLVAFSFMFLSTVVGQSVFFHAYTKKFFTVGNAFIEMVKINIALQFYTLILPGGAVALIRHKKFLNAGLPIVESFGVILFYRLMLLLISFLCAVIYFAQYSTMFLTHLSIGLEYFYIGIVCFLVISLVLVFIAKVLLKNKVGDFIGKLKNIKIFALQPMVVSAVVVVTSLFLGAFSYWLVFVSFGSSLSFIEVFMLRSTIFFFQVIPFSIAGVGIREIILAMILPMYGIEDTLVATIMIVIFSFQLVLGLLGSLQELFVIYKKGGQRESP